MLKWISKQYTASHKTKEHKRHNSTVNNYCNLVSTVFYWVFYMRYPQDINEMVHTERPDWQNVMTYVTAIYKYFETWRHRPFGSTVSSHSHHLAFTTFNNNHLLVDCFTSQALHGSHFHLGQEFNNTKGRTKLSRSYTSCSLRACLVCLLLHW